MSADGAAAGRRALTRQFVVAGLLGLAAVAVVLLAALGVVAFSVIDRVLFIVVGLAVVSAVGALRTLWRVRRDGVGAAVPGPPAPGEPVARPARDDHDAFLVVQRFRLLGDRYELTTASGEPVAVVERAAFQARERIEAFAPGRRLVFEVRAERILDVGGRYHVTGPDARRIGELRKLFAESLLRSTWQVYDSTGTLVALARERSVPIALARRGVDAIPVLGELLSLVPLPYHFDLRTPAGAPLGELRRLRTVRDRYALELPGDPDAVLDRRLALALAVSLDALQAR